MFTTIYYLRQKGGSPIHPSPTTTTTTTTTDDDDDDDDIFHRESAEQGY